MALLDQFSKAKDYTITFLKWELFGLLMGAWRSAGSGCRNLRCFGSDRSVLLRHQFFLCFHCAEYRDVRQRQCASVRPGVCDLLCPVRTRWSLLQPNAYFPQSIHQSASRKRIRKALIHTAKESVAKFNNLPIEFAGAINNRPWADIIRPYVRRT